MEQILTEHLLAAIAALAVAGTTIIQISPLKIDPWSALARVVGRAINKEMLQAIEKMQTDIEEHIRIDDERYIKQCRMRILRFSDEILQQKKHTKEHFDEVLDDITLYNNYCKIHHDYENAKAVMAIDNIERTYQRCIADKSFL